ncbi:helix-turn-helix transcriptional regulator [Enterococcus cecorum]|nr:helix-turn-helix transcriptional regulator [Enterococcus cecorum]
MSKLVDVEKLEMLLADAEISGYEIERQTGVARSTVADLRKGKAKLSRLSLGNALKLMAIMPFYDKCQELELVDDNYWWQDVNGNRWYAPRYTREQAAKEALTLENCQGCTNSHNLKDCINCEDCGWCESCKDCVDCKECSNCVDCAGCRRCKDAERLIDKSDNVNDRY